MIEGGVKLVGLITICVLIASPTTSSGYIGQYPIGLDITFTAQMWRDDNIVTSDRIIKYHVTRMATERGETVVEIHRSMHDNTMDLSDFVYVEIPNWHVENRTSGYPEYWVIHPLWWNTSGWSDGGTADIPLHGRNWENPELTSHNITEVSSLEIPAGEFSCWQAQRSLEGYNGTEALFYDTITGLCIKENYTFTSNGHEYRGSSSLVQFDFKSESPIMFLLIGGIISALVVITFIIWKRKKSTEWKFA